MTLPIIGTTDEQNILSLRRIKKLMKSIISEERLNVLALLHNHQDNHDEVIDIICSNK